ncbi:hypothetical protein GCM10010269_08250 [Streptomyces humidus]|uniref:Uncharacterized protein n=1 Tax=Streptomyces humidus TaxID=52259 RepID=A0A918L1R0_9ACTN|nr:hypothetical protein GCM10010269_08250 [Streptomyces humidus]
MATLPADSAYGVAREDRSHGLLTLVHQPWMRIGTENGQAGYSHTAVLDDVAVAEIKAQEIGVGEVVQLPFAPGARRWDASGTLAALGAIHVLPIADCSKRDAQLASYVSVSGSVTKQRDGLLSNLGSMKVHTNTLSDQRSLCTAKSGGSRERDPPLAKIELGTEGKVPRVGLEPTLYGF